MEKFNISLEELLKLKELGSGTEGKVFAYSKDIVLKIYRESINKLEEINKKIDEEDRIYNKSKLKIINNEEQIRFYDSEKSDNTEEKIRIRAIDALERISLKQKNIKRTSLPKGALMVDGKFSGCFMKRLYGIPIHKLTGFSEKYKLKILKNVFLDVEELLNNYIYHTDLSNSPFVDISYLLNDEFHTQKGHSHILINPFTFKTNILDLDGKSVPYTEKYDYKYEKAVLICLCTLLEEFYFKIDTKEIKEPDEIEFEIRKIKTKKELAKKIAYNKFENFNEMKKAFKM